MGIVSFPDGTYTESDPHWGWFWGLGPYVVLMDIPNTVFLMCVEFNQRHFNSSQLLMIDSFMIITKKRIYNVSHPSV